MRVSVIKRVYDCMRKRQMQRERKKRKKEMKQRKREKHILPTYPAALKREINR